jgi:hypothetical protein
MNISNPINSNINFIYFCFNYKHDFVLDCFKDEPVLAAHLNSKFNGDVLRFTSLLSRDNQYKLLAYIDVNYLAFKELVD